MSSIDIYPASILKWKVFKDSRTGDVWKGKSRVWSIESVYLSETKEEPGGPFMSYSATFRLFFVYFFITSIIYRLDSWLIFLQHRGKGSKTHFIRAAKKKREATRISGVEALAVETRRVVKREKL